MALLKPKGPSHDEIRSLVRAALQANQPVGSGTYVWTDQVYPDMVIYSVETNGVTQQYAVDYSIDKESKVTLGDPVPVIRKAVYEIVSFDIDLPDLSEVEFSGDVVHKDSILFKCGVYPDKGNFSLSQEEADQIVVPALNQGVGAKIEVEHVKGTVFSGLLGKVVKAWRVGDLIYGTTEWPVEVAKLLKGKKPKFSISLNSVTKLPIELSIVKNPRVEEAGVLTQFSKDSEQPADGRKGAMMSFKEKLAGLLGISSKEVEEGVNAEFATAAAPLESKIAALEAENAALKQGQSSQFAATAATTAQGEAERLFREGKLTPAERESFVTAFSAAITADGGVKFGANSQTEFGAVASAILKAYDSRQPMPVFGSQIHVIPGSDAGGDAQFGRKEVAESIDALNAGGKS